MTYSADPFPHWVIDNFLPTEMALQAWQHFYSKSHAESPWTFRHHLYSRRKQTRTHNLPVEVEQVMQALEGEGMRGYLETLTGVGPLYADPERFGGGQHVTHYNGRLGIHADFTHHPHTGRRRALNLLLYLNYLKGDEPRGDEAQLATGSLELWDRAVKRCVVRIAPRFNRAVIFETSATSYHGHPEPLKYSGTHDVNEFCEEGRMSLAVYYYVNAEKGDAYLRTTDYRPRPQDYLLRLRRRLRILVKGR